MDKQHIIQVALAGNPNSGKTSIFNALTGAHQHVGNYAGVTVEKREGKYSRNDISIKVLDLPGTYSLSSYSPEERIAQNELLTGTPDVVVVVVDSTTLKRSLVFLAQIMQLDLKLILCLNMSDEAKRAGQKINVQQLTNLLGIPIIETIGNRGIGIDDLRDAIEKIDQPAPKNRLVLGDRMSNAITVIAKKMETTSVQQNRNWIATKLLIADPLYTEQMNQEGESGREVIKEAEFQRKQIENETQMDINLFTTEGYYGFVDGLLKEVTERYPRQNARETSDRIDSVLVNRLLGLPIFFAVMYGIFWLTFTVGSYPMDWLDGGFGLLGEGVGSLWSPNSESALRSLLVDGIIGGVGGVIVFLPNIILLFVCLAFLEDTGYMARAAFLMDKLMHKFGLHGKSFIPMMTGFGCSIPGIMATRTLENERDRLTTMLVLPLMSCGARLPIWMLLIPAFFAPNHRAGMLWFIYMAGIGLALILALILRKSILKGEDEPFVMELPPYRLPTLKAVITKMAERSWLYIRKAGTLILAISVLMWVATTYPKPDSHSLDKKIESGSILIVNVEIPEDATPETKKELTQIALKTAQETSPAITQVLTQAELDNKYANEDLQYSLAGRFGKFFEPIFSPLGFDWKIVTGLFGSFAAKEVFVAQMGIIYSLGETDEESEGLQQTLSADYSPLLGLSLMLFLLISAPCMATIAVTRRESGSWKWAMFQLIGLTVLAYIISLSVFQIGSLFV